MADSSKTEKATPKKRRDERKKGNIFFSNDAVSVMVLLVSFWVIRLTASGITCLGQVPKQTVEEWEKAKKDQPSSMSFRQSLEQVIKQRKDKGGH